MSKISDIRFMSRKFLHLDIKNIIGQNKTDMVYDYNKYHPLK